MSRSIVLFLSLGLVACDKSEPTDTGTSDPGSDTSEPADSGSTPDPVDADGDGFSEDEDCDDTDATVNPDAVEACDGIDNDCDGTIDAGAEDAATWYFDADGDGYGDPETTTETCDAKKADYVLDATDCDDTEAAIFPGAEEICDGLDNDCSGAADPDDAVDAAVWFRDEDGDGHGAAEKYMSSCDQPSGYTAEATDCDDGDSAVSPDATEVCDGVDNDCSGVIDGGDAADATEWYSDADGDGYGTSDASVFACDAPSGFVGDATDCDDSASAVHPTADEVCDGIDNDCSGDIDSDAIDPTTWYADSDGDGFGDADTTSEGCIADVGYVADATDCDDTAAAVNSTAEEVCDGIDNDCSGDADSDATDRSTWFADSDGDGFGDASSSILSCDAPSGFLADATDCDDGAAAVSPAGTEVCDGIDNDCSGDIDVDAVDAATFYADSDADGYGDVSATATGCEAPSGYLTDASDCDDDAVDVNPGVTEVCSDGVDNDCDGGANGCFLEGDYDLGVVDVKMTGVAAYDYTGRSVACAGDLDGDGYDDIVVGAHKYNDATVGGDSGAAHILYGPVSLGSMSLADADARLIGEVASDLAGYAVNGAGDVDGDGFDDVLVGSYAHDGAGSNAGATWLVNGPITGEVGLASADAIINGTNAGDGFGVAVNSAGDLNGDGYDDLIMGAYGYQSSKGATYVFFGPVTGEFKSDTADAGFVGSNASDSLGWSVAPAGDLDGDGYDDIVIGSNQGGADDAGEVYVYYGDAAGSFSDYAFITGVSSADYAGQDVRGAGDLNGDGYDDIVIGAYGEDSQGGGAGATYVLYGPVVGDVDLSAGADAVIYGEVGGDTSGYSVAGVGDVNGDGWDDLMIGAYNNDQGGSNAGAAYLVYGPVEGEFDLTEADVRFTGESNGDSAGRYVSAAGDVNADGYADMLVGAQYDDDAGTDAGAAYLIYGRGL